MSIVPKEVVASIAAAWNLECGETFAAHIANRAAQWALEQVLGKLADEYVNADETGEHDDIIYNSAVEHCEEAIRNLLERAKR